MTSTSRTGPKTFFSSIGAAIYAAGRGSSWKANRAGDFGLEIRRPAGRLAWNLEPGMRPASEFAIHGTIQSSNLINCRPESEGRLKKSAFQPWYQERLAIVEPAHDDDALVSCNGYM
jgi:hypothetical protein